MGKPWTPGYKGISRKLRTQILNRDQYTCQTCGHEDKTGKTLQVDHITNVAAGGTNQPTNLQTLCTNCHKAKTHKENNVGKHRRVAQTYYPKEQHPGLTHHKPKKNQ